MVSGNPTEIRNVASRARAVSRSLDQELRTLESLYGSLRFDVANKGTLDELLRDSRQRVKAAGDLLTELERRLGKVAQQLDDVNRG